MTVTDEMVDAAIDAYEQSEFTDMPTEYAMKAALEAALSTIKPMSMCEIDNMLCINDHDDTYDLVESVEYWFGIRE